jgi:hypothetical protein
VVRLVKLGLGLFLVTALFGCGEKTPPDEQSAAPTASHPTATAGMEAGKTIDMRLGQTRAKDGK